MTLRPEFINALGFTEDPFAHTNADEEMRLAEYFVPPPYFAEVFGDPESPKSFLVFAPRGGGKTAQRKMMEKKCAERNVLCLTYVEFNFLDVRTANEVSLKRHIESIIRLGWTGLLVSIDNNPDLLSKLSKQSTSFLVNRTLFHLCKLSVVQFQDTLHDLRSQNHEVQAFIAKHSMPLTNVAKVVNAVLKAVKGIDLSALSSLISPSEPDQYDPKLELQLLIKIAKELGFFSVYVLVDRVDESPITWNDPVASFKLIEPMVKNLQLLEAPGIAFKFFLWDAILPNFTADARLDRVAHRTLKWERNALEELLSKRLNTFSDGKVRKLDSIAVSLRPYTLDEIAIVFANRSPRDIIRICSKIVAEQEQVQNDAVLLSEQSICKGVDTFFAKCA